MASQIIYALLGGILPAIVWLFFWLREDNKSPEPNNLILKTFFFGMLAVIFVIPFQKGVEAIFPELILISILLWAVFEEVFKFIAGYFGGLHSVEDNEPIDPIIYMITAALGFVALENTLFILGPLLGEETTQGIITGNMRFIGASLLHVVASGFVGVSLSFSFYQPKGRRVLKALFALIFAVLFHAGFNLLIIIYGGAGTAAAFISVWAAVLYILWAFEKSKTIAPKTESGYN